MNKLFITLLLIAFSINANSQTFPTNEIIAEGAAKIKVRPDIGTLTLTIEKIDSVERTSLKELNLQTQKMVSVLTKLGFNSDNIRISEYNISSSKSDDDNGGTKKEYNASNVLKVEFGLDPLLLDSFYRELEKSGVQDLDISFNATVSDALDKSIRAQLVQRAIEDAKASAENISRALKVKITGIKQVAKNRDEPRVADAVKMVKSPAAAAGRYDDTRPTAFNKYQIEEIELEEKIYITYLISN